MAKVKVKLLTSRVEQRGEIQVSQGFGEIIEVDTDEAKRLFDSQQAEPVAVRKKTEKAAKPASAKTSETR
jgi:hypothetical protein